MKKIGEIKGVPVVEGNINEVTKNQIHYKEDSGSIQLSKRGNDNKLNSVTGSSSGGGGGILYLKYNGERHFMYMQNNPCTLMIPVIACVAIYNSEGASNNVESFYIYDLYSNNNGFNFIDGFGEMAIPKMNNVKSVSEVLHLEVELNTTSLENIILSIAKTLSSLGNVDINEAIPQVKEMFKDWEECSEEEFYEIFNQYR